MVAASILPVSIHKGKLYFLFGKENPLEDSSKGWSDFGGGVEKNEKIIETAFREGGEELTGFLGDKNKIKKLIRKNGGVYKIEHNNYNVHIFFLDYNEDLPIYYNNNHSFLWEKMDKQYLNKTKLFEKIEIKWFSQNELKTKRNLFREFYREIVDKFIEHIPNIKKFIKKKYTIKNRKSIRKTMKRGR